jgi:hypothetical protein
MRFALGQPDELVEARAEGCRHPEEGPRTVPLCIPKRAVWLAPHRIVVAGVALVGHGPDIACAAADLGMVDHIIWTRSRGMCSIRRERPDLFEPPKLT